MDAAAVIQEKYKGHVILEQRGTPETVTGVDVAYSREDQHQATCAAVTMDIASAKRTC